MDHGRRRTAPASVSSMNCPSATRSAGRWIDTDSTTRSAVIDRTETADRVVLSVSIHRPAEQVAEGQFIELTEAGAVRLRPWSIRYAPPDELDAMAAAAGLQLENRWLGFGDRDFRDGDERHVSAWRARGE